MKSNKEKQQITSFPSLETPADCHKLKKHIALLCDRISKGFLPSGTKPSALEVTIKFMEVRYHYCLFFRQPNQAVVKINLVLVALTIA